MKTSIEIAYIAARNMVERHKIQRSSGESSMHTLAWGLGEEGLDYVDGLREFAAEVIKADRAERAADLAVIADAAAEWSAYLTDTAGDQQPEDREAMEAERDELQTALGRYLNESEAGR